MSRIELDHTLSADGDTTAVQITNSGYYALSAIGDPWSGTLTALVKANGQSSFATLSDVSLTANDAGKLIWLTQGDTFKANLTGGTSPSIKVILEWAY